MDKSTIALTVSIVSLISPIVLSGLLLWGIRKKSPESAVIALLTNVNTLSRILWKVAIPLIVGFTVFGVGLWAFTSAEIGNGQSAATEGSRIIGNELGLFKDLLTMVLAIAAVFISAVGVLAFFVLRSTLVDHVEKTGNERVWRSISRVRSIQAYILARQYEHTGLTYLLDLALEENQKADEFVRRLDESNLESEEVICAARNNWGYTLTMLQNPSNQQKILALSFADYLESKLTKYPTNADAWVDTILTIRTKFEPMEGS